VLKGGAIILLDKLSLKILKYISKHPNIHIKDLQLKFSVNCESNVKYLWKNEFIRNEISGYSGVIQVATYTNQFVITPKGTSYIEEIPKNRFFKIYPLIISTLALITSLLALLKSFELIFT
jgi:hypothetical protein